MKGLILSVSFLLLLMGNSFGQASKKTIKDGLYLIDKIDTDAAKLSPVSSKEAAIRFSPLFDEYNHPGEFTRLIIDVTDYVPLELETAPKTEQQTEIKKKLLLSLTPEASEKLKSFTAKHVMQRVAVVVGGEALTMHKIKMAITSGQLQISRCTDNACELLYVKLKDNVKKD